MARSLEELLKIASTKDAALEALGKTVGQAGKISVEEYKVIEAHFKMAEESAVSVGLFYNEGGMGSNGKPYAPYAKFGFITGSQSQHFTHKELSKLVRGLEQHGAAVRKFLTDDIDATTKAVKDALGDADDATLGAMKVKRIKKRDKAETPAYSANVRGRQVATNGW